MRPTLTVIALALVATQAWAQIYKTVDNDGNVSFTDTPPPNTDTEQVQLQQTNSAPPPATIPSYDGDQKADVNVDTEATAVPRATITAPANETTIPMGGGNFSVSAIADPGLEKGQSLRLLLDGEPYGKDQPSGFWDLTNVFRGAHDLVVEVIDASGSALSQSEPVRVYVLRPSVN